MHEYSLMQGVIQAVLERLEPPAAVQEVTLRIGALEVHSADSCRQAYALLTKGTPLEGAQLRLVIVPAVLHCPACGFRGLAPVGDEDEDYDPLPCAPCPACKALASLEGGRGVQGIELVLSGAPAGPEGGEGGRGL